MGLRAQIPVERQYVASRQLLTTEETLRVEELAFRHGEAYDSYLALEPGREYFFSSTGDGVIAFARWRRHVFVVGGLLAPRSSRAGLLEEFLNFARGNRLSPRFFNLLATDLALYRQHGLLVSKIGEEPIIDLRQTSWRGRAYEWLRRQENYCTRGGMKFRELDISLLPDAERSRVIAELNEVSRAHVSNTAYNRELTLTVAQVNFEQMHRRRLFVAENDGKVDAFIVANPAYAGAMWAVETYRRRPEASRGVIPFLMLKFARQLQEEEVPVLSLCQVPSLRAGGHSHSDCPFVRRAMSLWWKAVPWFYDPQRQYHFKSRFRPAYRECFVAAPPGSQFVPYAVFGLKWGVLTPDLGRLPGHMLKRMKKWSHQERLADPSQEQYEIICDLRDLLPPSGLVDAKSPRSAAPDYSVLNGTTSTTFRASTRAAS